MFPITICCFLLLGITGSISANSSGCDEVNEYLLRAACNNNSPRVYFSATRKLSTTLSANQKIVFDDMYVNRGDAYNSTTGVFVCPKEGDYQFSFHILKTTDVGSNIDLFVNTNARFITWSPGRHLREMSNGELIIHLQRGDKVFLQGRQKGVGIYGDRHSIFTGRSL